MALTLDEVGQIAETAARGVSPELKIAGVTVGGADSSYIEVLVTFKGCTIPPCQVSIGAFRDVVPAELQHQLAEKLRTHLAEYTRAS